MQAGARFEEKRSAQVSSGREYDLAAAVGFGYVDHILDGGCLESCAVVGVDRHVSDDILHVASLIFRNDVLSESRHAGCK